VITPSDVEEIRQVIGRHLEGIESRTYETLDSIPPAVEAIALALATARRRILAIKYLHERVPSADRGDVMLKVEALETRQQR
jgi:hypothetical protein